MITEDYVSLKTAKLLKEKGFDWEESPFYSEQDRNEWRYNNSYEIPNPTYNKDIPFDSETQTMVAPHISIQMAMKWLRKEHYCHIIIDYTFTADANLSEEYVSYCYKVENAKTYIQHTQDEWYNTFEEACEAAIKYCLEILI